MTEFATALSLVVAFIFGVALWDSFFRPVAFAAVILPTLGKPIEPADPIERVRVVTPPKVVTVIMADGTMVVIHQLPVNNDGWIDTRSNA